MKVEDVMNKNVISLNENSTISKAVELMVKNRIHQIPIINKNFEGMVYIKDIIKIKSDLSKTSVKKIIKKTFYLEENYDLEKAIKILLEVGNRALPVLKNGEVVGILSEVDIITKGIKISGIKVEEIMNKPITIEENDSLKKAIRMMEKYNISSLPIVNWEEKLVGCINIFSFAKLVSKEKESIESLKSAKEKVNFLNNPVKNFSFSPITCKKDETIENIVNYFKDYEEVIVVGDGKPIGIIKPRDILMLFFEKEKIPILTSGIKLEEVEKVFSFSLEKWKKIGVEKVAIILEKIGGKEKYEGKIKIYFKNKSFLFSSISYDKFSLLKELRDLANRKIIQEKERGKKL
ncbi:MAG: CBS domain-containing protein [Candidatus Aenigmatarchaeota archaeon]